MKKVLITIFSAVLIGSLFGLWYFKETNNEVAKALSIDNTANAFQVGVFRNYDNALNEANKYKSATIVTDGEFFRVYIGLAGEGDSTEYLKKYFDSKGYLYYIKKVVIPDSFLESFEKYQEVILKTDDVDLINKKVLEEYSKSINGI